jgi:hypothetical protein
MKDGKKAFNVLASVEKHIESLKPLLPRQAIVCIGEYPIKLLLKEPYISKIDNVLTILIEKSSEDIYNWIPKQFNPNFILGFEDTNIDTHFWYNVMPYLSNDNTFLERLNKKTIEQLQGTIMVASVWDGINSASLPTLTNKLKASHLNSISIAIFPSKVQPIDAHFNALASIKNYAAIEDSTIVIIERDHLESYEGVDRKGALIKGNMVTNYLFNLLLGRETFVQEISELSRIFSTKVFTILFTTGASYKIYNSIKNMLNMVILKPLLTFDLSSSSLLYVLIQMPISLKDKLPRGKIELEIADWFKDKAELKSIYVSEPIYVEDQSDRIDMVLFIGGFDTTKMFSEWEKKIKPLKDIGISKGYMTEEWQINNEKTKSLENENRENILKIIKNEKAYSSKKNNKKQPYIKQIKYSKKIIKSKASQKQKL